MTMDISWFKAQQRRAGVRTEDIARIAGRSRTAVSNIYAGRQRMTLDWAKAFSEALSVPLEEVLSRAGEVDREGVPIASSSQAAVEGDVSLLPQGALGAVALKASEIARVMGGGPSVDLWLMRRAVMSLQGILPGDVILVDREAGSSARAGDMVLAEVYSRETEGPALVVRRLEPPVLIPASPEPSDQRVFVVDGVNVSILGKVVGCWRSL